MVIIFDLKTPRTIFLPVLETATDANNCRGAPTELFTILLGYLLFRIYSDIPGRRSLTISPKNPDHVVPGDSWKRTCELLVLASIIDRISPNHVLKHSFKHLVDVQALFNRCFVCLIGRVVVAIRFWFLFIFSRR